jgi:hypothetical protein
MGKTLPIVIHHLFSFLFASLIRHPKFLFWQARCSPRDGLHQGWILPMDFMQDIQSIANISPTRYEDPGDGF